MVAVDGSLHGGLFQEIVHCAWGSDGWVGGVGIEHEVEDDNHEDEGVRIVAEEGRSETAEDNVCAYACDNEWLEQELGQDYVPTGMRKIAA